MKYKVFYGIISVIIFLSLFIFIPGLSTIYSVLNGAEHTKKLEQLSNIGSVLSGTVGVLWALASILLFYVTILKQQELFDNNLKEERLRNDNDRIIDIIYREIDLIPRLTKDYTFLTIKDDKITEDVGYNGIENLHNIILKAKSIEKNVNIEEIIAFLIINQQSIFEILNILLKRYENILKIMDSSTIDNITYMNYFKIFTTSFVKLEYMLYKLKEFCIEIKTYQIIEDSFVYNIFKNHPKYNVTKLNLEGINIGFKSMNNNVIEIIEIILNINRCVDYKILEELKNDLLKISGKKSNFNNIT